jgi:hypothetical protein
LAAQAAIQATALVALPVAVAVAIPLGWVLAFYHSATVVGDGEAGVRETLQRSLRQAMLWPVQNHLGIGMGWFFAIFVLANVMILIVLGPWFLQSFLGIKTLFMMNLLQTFNSTYIATAVMVTYALVNPLVKAFYVLRCFYGESRHTGADLRAELTKAATARGWTAALAMALLAAAWLGLFGGTTAARAEPSVEAVPAPARAAIAPLDLDRSIDRTLEQREYTWRLPREWDVEADGEKNFLQNTIDTIVDQLVRIKTSIYDGMQRVFGWVGKLFKPRTAPLPGGPVNFSAWTTFLKALTAFLLVGLLAALGYTIWRAWKRRQKVEEIMGETVTPLPDVADESVTADQLPSDGWIDQARELMERGELRLAMRALYLASLAMLAHRELILIAKFKSNREYERELNRRARGQADLLGAFGQNLVMFENAWYGMHDVTGDMVSEFNANLERIRSHAQS